MITTISVLAYCLVGLIFHIGIYKCWKEDEDPEMKKFNDYFIQFALLGSSLLWPVLVLVAVVQKFKNG
ncbi:MAG: hypothetical protein ACRC6V_01600 [Bacteroidales bacterium]